MKCLVVSDIETARDEMILSLQETGLFSSVGGASAAEQALAKLKKYPFGIIVLDLDASQANMDLLKSIRAEKIFVCVIMMSTENSIEYISEAFSYGVSDYIIKPYTGKRFGEAAMRAVSKRECLLQYNVMSQEEVDHCISLSVFIAPDDTKAKGISNETFSFVKTAVSELEAGFTSADIAKLTGLSRITVRKYLERMCESGILKTELEYGEIGRPQKHYYSLEKPKNR
jgi:two-component system, CitB family, response regulator